MRCHFELFSSRSTYPDLIGDEFDNFEEARRMARSVLIDFASKTFSDGEEFKVVCALRIESSGEIHLTSLSMNDVRDGANSSPLNNDHWFRLCKHGERIIYPKTKSDAIYRMSGDWSELREIWNDGVRHIEEIPDRGWFLNYIPPSERPLVGSAIYRAIRFRSPYSLEHKIFQADGSIGWRRSHALPLIDANGRISDWIGVTKDVTALHAV